MKTLVKISDGLQKYASRYYIIPLLILFILITGTMEFSPIGSVKLRELNGGLGMLDMQKGGYTSTLVYDMLGQIGPDGRALYTKLLGLDYIFAIVYMLLQSLMITNLLRRVGAVGEWKLLNLLPFLRSGLDILENCLILALIFSFPAQLTFLAAISSTVTLLKWFVYGCVIVVVFSLGAITSSSSFTPKSKTQKEGKSV